MHVVHVWDYFPLELRYHIHYLTDELTALGHQVTIVASDKSNRHWVPFLETVNPPAGEYRYGDARVIRIPCWEMGGKQIPKSRRQLRGLLQELRPDVLHLFGLPRPMTVACARLTASIEPRPVVFANDHSHSQNERQGWLAKLYYAWGRRNYWRHLAPHLQRIIVPNLASRDFLQRRYALPDEILRIIPLGYDERQFAYRPEQKNKSPKLILGFAGKLQRAKRIEWLFESMRECQHRQQIACHIVGDHGDEYSRELHALAERWELDVVFRPLLKPEQLAEFYNFIDVAVFPGSISITTQEATGCGTPVLLYESIPGLEDRVAEGRGYLFRERAELTQRIDETAARKFSGAMEHRAIEHASKAWAWSGIVHRYLAEYNEALARRNRRV